MGEWSPVDLVQLEAVKTDHTFIFYFTVITHRNVAHRHLN